jgi:hypothetical protein
VVHELIRFDDINLSSMSANFETRGAGEFCGPPGTDDAGMERPWFRDNIVIAGVKPRRLVSVMTSA